MDTVVNPDGSVRAAALWPPGVVERCTLKVVEQMLFPPFAGDAVELSVPLR